MIGPAVEHALANTALLGTVGALLLYYILAYSFGGRPKFDAVLVEAEGDDSVENNKYANLNKKVAENFGKYRNDFFKIKQPHDEIVLIPPKYMEELKALPDSKLSFKAENDDRFITKYTGINPESHGGDSNAVVKSVQTNLTQSLNSLMEDIYDETEYAFGKEIGSCEDWTEITVAWKLLRIIVLVSGRVFAGPELNRNEDYMSALIMYTINVFNAAGELYKYPAVVRPLASYWIPEMKEVRKSEATMRRIMAPVVMKRAEELRRGEKKKTMTSWIMGNSDPKSRESVNAQAQCQLVISMAAIHTSTLQTTHAVFDLAAHPEYHEPLRAEIEAALAAEDKPHLSKGSMPKLRMLDSFLKESQRVNPLGLLTFNRKVMSDITLHDGRVLPKGIRIAVAASQITSDPQIWPEPEKFDGYRFTKLRDQQQQQQSGSGGGGGGRGGYRGYQFVQTGMEMPSFGYGIHACPGRFFAANEIKVILTYLLLNYDIKFPEGQSRPENVWNIGGSRPDPAKVVLLRRRRTTITMSSSD